MKKFFCVFLAVWSISFFFYYSPVKALAAEDEKFIAFTFDDAPDSTAKNLLKVFLDFNKKHPDYAASATFFCNGIRMDETTLPVLSALHTCGFELGNHTYGHKDLTRLPLSKIKEQIDETDKLLYFVDGKKNHLLRTPFGTVNEKVRLATNAPIIYWSIDTKDWKGISAEQIFSAVYSGRKNGAIVLMHDGYINTVTAVEKLLPALREDGYRVTNVSFLSETLRRPLKAGGVYKQMTDD